MRHFFVLGFVVVAGCQMDTASSCSSVPPIVGAWRYSATEETPARAAISGTLSITSASCEAIVGSMDVVETTATGGTQRLAGPITGQVVDGTSFQFNAFLEATPRQHLASFKGDSLSGSWVNANGGQAETGSFEGKRQ